MHSLFDEKGNLPRDFDPYRCSRGEDEPRYSLLFDEDGFLLETVARALPLLVEVKGFGPWCDAVAMYHADTLARNTKGSYPTIYYWR